MRDIPEGQDYVMLKEPDNRTPQGRARQQIMSNDSARMLMAESINNARRAAKNPRVTSNRELEERIDQYFQMAADRMMPPTIEELSLFCGYTSSTLNAWKLGKIVPFHDGEEVGVTTIDIIKKAYEIMHSVDAVLTETGKLGAIPYIFRAKNYYGLTDKQEVTITPNVEQRTMSREQIEEIARNLPDAGDTFGADGTVE